MLQAEPVRIRNREHSLRLTRNNVQRLWRGGCMRIARLQRVRARRAIVLCRILRHWRGVYGLGMHCKQCMDGGLARDDPSLGRYGLEWRHEPRLWNDHNSLWSLG